MIRRYLFGLSILLLVGCSDDDTKFNADGPVTVYDSAVGADKQILKGLDSQNVPQDGGPLQVDAAPKPDSQPLKPDAKITPDQASKPDTTPACTPKAATKNTGNLCGIAKGCAAEEVCWMLPGEKSGVCLGKCCPDLANPSSKINVCPTPFSYYYNYVSLCSTSLGAGKYACSFICEAVVGGQIKKYDCPGISGYKCVALKPGDSIKVCVSGLP